MADMAPHLYKADALAFAHGFNIHFGQVQPSADVDVFMIAPKAPGHIMRRLFKEGVGVPCLLAIHQDATGNAKRIALAYAKGVGGTKAGVIETTFREETETDLFGEQAVLCGGVTELVRAGFDTLMQAGYQPEIAYFECLHELKLIVDLIYEGGISMMRYSVSDTAQYGDITRGRRVITQETREAMKKLLAEIQSGEFAREWIMENKANRPVFNALTKRDAEHPIEVVGSRLRQMMILASAHRLYGVLLQRSRTCESRITGIAACTCRWYNCCCGPSTTASGSTRWYAGQHLFVSVRCAHQSRSSVRASGGCTLSAGEISPGVSCRCLGPE